MNFGWSKRKLDCGVQYLTAPTDVTCTTAGTWYKIGGVWEVHSCGVFSTDVNGKLTYNGGTQNCLHIGTFALKVNKACLVSIGAYVNGTLHVSTDHTFNTQNKIDSVATNKFIPTNKGDELEIWCKSDTDATTVTFSTLCATTLGLNI